MVSGNPSECGNGFIIQLVINIKYDKMFARILDIKFSCVEALRSMIEL